MSNSTIDFEIGECLFCFKKASYSLDSGSIETDYGTEYDACAYITCEDENCFLNRFEELQDDCQEWESNGNGYESSEDLKPHIIGAYKTFKEQVLIEKLVDHIEALENKLDKIERKDQVLDYND